jgi:uncharacterized protein with PQ loop repeat
MNLNVYLKTSNVSLGFFKLWLVSVFLWSCYGRHYTNILKHYFCSALSDEEKQQIISSAIIPVFLLGILTSYSKVSIVISFVFSSWVFWINLCLWLSHEFYVIYKICCNFMNDLCPIYRRLIRRMWSPLWKIHSRHLLLSKKTRILCIWFVRN